MPEIPPSPHTDSTLSIGDVVSAGIRPPQRVSGSLATISSRRRYVIGVVVLAAAAFLIAVAFMSYNNKFPMTHPYFWTKSRKRLIEVGVIAVVAVAQTTATITFQTITNNRILTPSIMGFDSLYRLVQTVVIFTLGIRGAAYLKGPAAFVVQILLMVVFATTLYGLLLTGRHANLNLTLLVGLVLGGGLASISTFLARLLDPSEHDVLVARQIGSIGKGSQTNLSISIPIVVAIFILIMMMTRQLNVLALGRGTAVNLGTNYQRLVLTILILVSILIAVSTALAGPMTFFGFLVAMMTYQLVDSFDHRLLIPFGALLAFVTLGSAFFILRNIFSAQGSVGVIIELIGGTFFLLYILRKGRIA